MIMYLHIAKGSGRRLGDILRFEVSARYRYPILSQFFFQHGFATSVTALAQRSVTGTAEGESPNAPAGTSVRNQPAAGSRFLSCKAVEAPATSTPAESCAYRPRSLAARRSVRHADSVAKHLGVPSEDLRTAVVFAVERGALMEAHGSIAVHRQHL